MRSMKNPGRQSCAWAPSRKASYVMNGSCRTDENAIPYASASLMKSGPMFAWGWKITCIDSTFAAFHGAQGNHEKIFRGGRENSPLFTYKPLKILRFIL